MLKTKCKMPPMWSFLLNQKYQSGTTTRLGFKCFHTYEFRESIPNYDHSYPTWMSLSHVQLFATPWAIYSPWNSQGQKSWMCSLCLLQGIFPTQGSNPGLPHCGQILYQLSHKRSPRILEWVAYPFSSRSSRPRNRTGVSCIAGGFFTNWAEGSLKECNQVTTELTHHALILHIIGWEGPELGSCRVHSRLPWVQPIKENKLQKSSQKQGPQTY